MQEQEERLNVLLDLKQLQSTDPEEFWDQMTEQGMDTETALEEAIITLEEALGRPLSFTHGDGGPSATEEYPLLDVPDSELNEEQLKDKKRQRFLKSTREGRANAKRKREQTIVRQEKEKELEEQRYQQNPSKYIEELHQRRKVLLDKREQRQKIKQQATSGRRQVASQQRLKILTQLDSDDKKGKRKAEDTFGKEDSDWNIYLSLDEAETQQEDEELLTLEHVEGLLTKYDSSFTVANAPPDNSDIPPIQYAHQLHLGIERVRVPEMLYEPSSIVGVEQMGLAEIVHSIFDTFPRDIQSSMAMNIFCTGGNTSYHNFKERLECEVRMMLPSGSSFRVVESKDAMLDAWRGMCKFYQDNMSQYGNVVLTKAEYDEKGADYFKPHFASNIPY